ncbi:hypothetical protein DFH08DRAFT_860567 [Mycena albidolilacea]|uniref:Uncharacterized protein n=1 Tax=Mycena albidolilacea TaxID=1033008 RepID=A0AAD7A7S1_9AGAR|nr:hypothetical protein DFH08DRAFT_860567 [Mycena albidolilacea]
MTISVHALLDPVLTPPLRVRLSLVRHPPTPSLWRPTARWTSAQTRMGDASMSSESARKSKSSGYWEQLVRLGRVLYEERGDTYGRARLLVPADNGSARRREVEWGWEWGTGTTGYAWPSTDLRLAERPQSTGRKDPVLLSLLLISQDALFTIRPSTLDVCTCPPHCPCPRAHLTFAAWLPSPSLDPPSALSLHVGLSRLRLRTCGCRPQESDTIDNRSVRRSGNQVEIAYDAYDERRDTAPRLVEICFSLQLISLVPFSSASCSTDSLFTSPSSAFTIPSVDWWVVTWRWSPRTTRSGMRGAGSSAPDERTSGCAGLYSAG